MRIWLLRLSLGNNSIKCREIRRLISEAQLN